MTEREFLISLAISQYNQQYGMDLTVEGCDILSIPVRDGFDRSYEIFTKRTDDFVRMHVHFLFDSIDNVFPYVVEVDGSNYTQQLGDEVFVATGTIDRYWSDSGTYKFWQLNDNAIVSNIFLLEDNTPLLMEDGSYVLTEAGN